MQINISKIDGKVTGINQAVSPLNFIIEVGEEFNLTKTIEVLEEENTVLKVITFKDNPTEFTVEEIIQAKYQSMLDNSQKDYILADTFLTEEDLDITDINHKANTGVGFIELQPLGQCKAKTITLEIPAKDFKILEFIADEGIEVYLEEQKFTGGSLALSNEVSSCTIKFINTTNKPKQVKSYAICY